MELHKSQEKNAELHRFFKNIMLNMEILRNNVSLNKSSFCELINISPSSYSDILYNRANPSLQMIIGVFQAYPNLNLSWLFYNQGEMFLAPATVNRLKEPASQFNTPGEWDVLSARLNDIAPQKRQAILKIITGLLDML